MRHQDQSPLEFRWLALRELAAAMRLGGLGSRVQVRIGNAEEAAIDEHHEQHTHLRRAVTEG